MNDDLISRRRAIKLILGGKIDGDSSLVECVEECNSMLDWAADEIKALPTAEPQWIPVTERLPEHFGRYLVTIVPDAGELWTKVDFAMFSDLMGLKKEPIFWNGNVGKADFENVTKNVTAWMPLPTPWKGESDATD